MSWVCELCLACPSPHRSAPGCPQGLDPVLCPVLPLLRMHLVPVGPCRQVRLPRGVGLWKCGWAGVVSPVACVGLAQRAL